jgi:arylsulfatase A-like enzyme
MLPALLREKAAYRTHATGKWDIGRILEHCTPTHRGFETFLGYWTACTADYWYHGAPGAGYTADSCGGVDFSNATVPTSTYSGIKGATMSGVGSVNDTYDRIVFQNRAIEVIEAHDPSEPLYLHVAWHNVHDSCTADRTDGALVLQAPKETVDMYGSTKEDRWKVQAAMTTELDYGIGNVTEALKTAGLWNNTVMIFVSDNGGPLDHSNNAPRRAGKATWGEGGVNVVSFVASPLLDDAVKGGTWHGLAHTSDWYVTIAEGLAGVSTANTGPRPPDGFNLWDAINANATSPRTEVIHAVLGKDVVPPVNSSVCRTCSSASAQFGKWKLIVGTHSLDLPQAWPEPGPDAVPFGESGGKVESGTDHARCASGPVTAHSETSDSGIWLFDLEADRYETTNLASEPQYAGLVANLTAQLAQAAKSAPAPAFVYPPNASDIICANEHSSGFLEPADWHAGA